MPLLLRLLVLSLNSVLGSRCRCLYRCVSVAVGACLVLLVVLVSPLGAPAVRLLFRHEQLQPASRIHPSAGTRVVHAARFVAPRHFICTRVASIVRPPVRGRHLQPSGLLRTVPEADESPEIHRSGSVNAESARRMLLRERR
jgi:hypothetical protein